MSKLSKFTRTNYSFGDDFEGKRERASATRQQQKKSAAPAAPSPVDIVSDFPPQEVLEMMRQLKTPKLVRITKSLF